MTKIFTDLQINKMKYKNHVAKIQNKSNFFPFGRSTIQIKASAISSEIIIFHLLVFGFSYSKLLISYESNQGWLRYLQISKCIEEFTYL